MHMAAVAAAWVAWAVWTCNIPHQGIRSKESGLRSALFFVRPAPPARRADEADVRLPPKHAAMVCGHPQRRHLGERRLRAAVAFRGGEGRQDLLTLGARSKPHLIMSECVLLVGEKRFRGNVMFLVGANVLFLAGGGGLLAGALGLIAQHPHP